MHHGVPHNSHVLTAHERYESYKKERHGNWIQKATGQPFKKGALTRQAKAHGTTAMSYAHDVLAHPGKHDLKTRRRAQFAVNASGK
jgi:hypothetical protein